MTKVPLVSVIIPTYNYAHLILDAIESVHKQTYSSDNIEIVVIDDGSTDDTHDKLRNLIEDKKIVYHYQNNSGKSAATIKGRELARGEYIFNMDADDLFEPSKIEKVVDVYLSHPNVSYVAHRTRFLDISTGVATDENIPKRCLGKEIEGNELLIDFYNNNTMFGGATTFSIRKQEFNHMPMDPKVDMYTDEMLVIFALKDGLAYFIDECLSIGRSHGGNFSNLKAKEAVAQKQQRLIESSRALNDLVQRNAFHYHFKKLFLLSHLVRETRYAEIMKKSKLRLIFKLWILAASIYNPLLRPQFYVLVKRYNIVKRSLPLYFVETLKKIVKN